MLDGLFFLAHPWLASCPSTRDSALYGDKLWLAPLCVLFPLLVGPAGNAWPQWVCLIVPTMTLMVSFCTLLSSRLVRPSPWSMTLSDFVSHSDTAGKDDVVQCPLLSCLLVQTCWFNRHFVCENSKWTSSYLRLFMHSMTSQMEETAGIACSTALLLRMHHRACALLGLTLTLHVCTDENHGFAADICFFHSKLLQFVWACGPLIQGGYCLCKITLNCYCQTITLTSWNDCEVLKLRGLIQACPCFFKAYHIKVIDHLFRDNNSSVLHLHSFMNIFWSISWTAFLLLSF